MRKLSNWIDAFVSLNASSSTPDSFKLWGAIGAVAGALERRVWVDVGLGPLYPNMYTFLVGGPGVGKTLVTNQVRQMWVELDNGTDTGLRIASQSLTSASIVDELRDATRRIFAPGNALEPTKFNALAMSVNELGVLLPAYEPDLMNKLTDLYDGIIYSERRRWAKSTDDAKGFTVESPLINLFAATTPGYLTNLLPEGAFDMGFMSRVILVFSAERNIVPLFQRDKREAVTIESMKQDMHRIFALGGEMSFTADAKNALIEWHSLGGPPIPDHPRLQNYITRRTAHILKLCMIASASQGDDRIITIDHLNRAFKWLFDAEQYMPDIFKAMQVDNTVKVMDECWHFAYVTYIKEGNRPVAEYRLIEFLKQRVPVQHVMTVLTIMTGAKLIEKEMLVDVGNAYKPKPRRPGS